MNKLKQNDKKAKRRIKCECCNKDKKRNISYYRNGKYFINKTHWIKYKIKQEKKNVSTQKS